MMTGLHTRQNALTQVLTEDDLMSLRLSDLTVEAASDAVYWVDRNARFFRVNQAACNQVGYSREELLEMYVFDVNPEFAPQNWDRAWEMFRQAGSMTKTSTHRRKDGSIFPIEASVNFVEYDQAEFTYVFIRDITERKRVEDALRESEQRYRSLYLNTPCMLYSLDQNRQIASVSEYFLAASGYSREEMIGRCCSEFLAPASRRYAEEVVIPRLFTEGSITNIPYQFVCKNGAIRDVLISAIAEKDESGHYVRSLSVVTDVTERNQAEEKARRSLEELQQIKSRLQEENIYLQEEIKLEHNFDKIIGNSQALKKVLSKTEQVADTEATVLILGESGTGKELIARAIHHISERQARPLVKVNVAALPRELIESELFGHEKGAFSGAYTQKIGRFELADGGTIFLDEIGELPPDLQVKLLRVLQEGEFERVGGCETLQVDTRVIAATNRNLEQAVNQGDFREDLYYRLNVFPIQMPPLRERLEDIPLLVNHFVKKFQAKMGRRIDQVPPHVLDDLKKYGWPGNVRELENVIERAVILTQGCCLQIEELADHRHPIYSGQDKPGVRLTLKEQERRLILQALQETNWVVEGKKGAARHLDIPPSTLRERIKKYQLSRPI